MATTYCDLSHSHSMHSMQSFYEPQRPRYDPVTEICPRVPRVPSSTTSRPVERVSRQPLQGSTPTRTLPGLSELFASKLLVAPDTWKTTPTSPADIAGATNGPFAIVPSSSSSHPTAARHERSASQRSPSRSIDTPALSSPVSTSPGSWTSELPPLQDTHAYGRTRAQQSTSRSPALQSESFGASVVGCHGTSFPPDHSIPRHGHSLAPSPHSEEVQVHRVDSRAGWRESDLHPTMPELLPATYMYRADCGMIASPQPYPDCPAGFSVPGREDLVYPMWDLTKRKLPRKRMSTACTDCRKKKIRCEPGVGGCLQCRKAQKPCIVEPVKRRRRKKALSTDVEDSDDGSEELDKSRSS